MKWTVKSLREVGAFQWTIIIIYAVTTVPWEWGNFGILVIAPRIPHWCRDASPGFQNLTAEQQRQIMTSSGVVCQRPDVNFTAMTSDEILAANFSAVPWVACDQGVSYDHSEFDYTATEQYNLGCGKDWIISMANTIYMFGFLVASAASGAVADRFGRKTVLVASAILGAGAHLLAALAPGLVQFLVGRFIAAMCEIAAFTSASIFCMEFLRKDQRVVPPVALAVIRAIGSAGFGALAMVVRNHQHIQLIVAACFLAGAVVNFCYFPKSPRWLMSQHRHDEARAVLQRISAFNKQQTAINYICSNYHHDDEERPPPETRQVDRKATLLDLVRTRTLRKRTAVLCIMWFNLVLVSYVLTFNLGDFGPDVRTSIIIAAVFAFPALVVTMCTVDRFGRQVSAFAFMLAAGVCCFAMGPLVGATDSPLLLALAIMGKLLCGNQYFIVYLYTPELYPTVIRTTGLGTASTVARVAGMLAPQISLLNRFWAPCLVVVLGFAGVVSAALTPLLPDTTGYELPQSLEDGERFRADHRYKLVLPRDFPLRCGTHSNKTKLEPPVAGQKDEGNEDQRLTNQAEV